MRGIVFLISIATVALSLSCNRIDREKFEPIYRAAKALEGAANVNVTLMQLSPLVQAYSTEVSILEDKINPKNPNEKKILDFHKAALQAYSDSQTLWANKIEADSQQYVDYVTCGLKDSTIPGINDLCDRYEKYGITLEEHTSTYGHQLSDEEAKRLGITTPKAKVFLAVNEPELAIVQIWQYAQKQVDEAQKIINQ